jgi:hypothetical protein
LRSAARPLAILIALAAILAAPKSADAQERRAEEVAKEAIKRARSDFSAGDFDGALARLLRASRACGTLRCSAPTRAVLFRDIGVMQFRRGSTAKADAAFAEALHIDGRVELSAPYDVPDIRAEWDAVIEAASFASSPQPLGDFTHTAPPEGLPNTPLPLYVEYGGSDKIASVVVKYKSTGSSDWRRVTLPRSGAGWGGSIPCSDVTLGVLLYYVQGFDPSGTPTALSGDPKHPFHTAIRRALVGPPPSLPGQPPPAVCGAGALPSGPAQLPIAPVGPQCVDDTQCDGAFCQDGRCAATPPEVDERTNYARLWFGVSLSADLLVMPGANDVCKLSSGAVPINSSGYYCTNPDGSDYPTRQTVSENNALATGNAGQVNGSPAVGNVRLLASFDYAVSPNVLVGARFGAVMHTNAGAAAASNGRELKNAIQIELRGSYVFGKNALAHSGFAPLVFVDGGAARFDSPQVVTVTQTGVPGQLPKTAWLTGGPGFAGFGGGFRYAFSQRIAFNASAKVAFAFGASGVFPTLGPEAALQYGF